MEQQQTRQILIGVNSTVFFLAIALTMPFVNQLLRRWQIPPVLLLGLLLMGLSGSMFSLTKQLSLWLMLWIVLINFLTIQSTCGQALCRFEGIGNRQQADSRLTPLHGSTHAGLDSLWLSSVVRRKQRRIIQPM